MIWWVLLPAPVPGAPPQPAQNSRSPHGSLNLPCQNCHTVYGWKPIRAVPEFDHNQTRYPLRGMHEGVACTACHTKMVFSNVGNKCADCHADIHKRQMGANCESCHTVRGWKVSVQQINQHMNRFPLTGAHAAATCEDCHKNGALSQFTTMSTACLSCHQKDFQAAKNPDHVAGKFATTCQTCHSTDNWLNARFDHALTGFPLTGAHTVPPRACADCHVNNNYNLTQTSCVSCHLKDFQNTNNPNHAQQGFSQTCEGCHTTVAWSPANFDHSKSGFPLTGAHTVPPRACADCHVNNNYNLTQTSCVSCHQQDYNNAKQPVDHIAAGFPTTCETCHDTVSWMNGKFDHAQTGWVLTGSHTVPPRACADCHVNGNYKLNQTTCVTCHQQDYNKAANPNHVQAGFPLTCETCHDTVAWTDGKFDHAQTGWALTGSHMVPPRQCGDCHVNNNYKLNNTACVTCHLTDYNNTNNPNHVQAGFPQTCEVCHDTIKWTDANFNHSKTGFPLTGSHTVPPRVCADCHVNNNYKNLPTDCYGCHKADYQNANNPNHIAAHFPTTCATCHDTIKWADGKFNHTWFPLNHGGANGVCSTCHTNPNNYTVFTCTNCHAKAQTDARHQGVGGYVYNSVNCYQCHKN